jgi:hypothetical protein
MTEELKVKETIEESIRREFEEARNAAIDEVMRAAAAVGSVNEMTRLMAVASLLREARIIEVSGGSSAMTGRKDGQFRVSSTWAYGASPSQRRSAFHGEIQEYLASLQPLDLPDRETARERLRARTEACVNSATAPAVSPNQNESVAPVPRQEQKPKSRAM